MKLNIGSGLKRYEGFLNVDVDPRMNPDVVVDLNKGFLPFDNDSVDEIIAHHILEHIGENFLLLMQEIYRVCKDGAIIDIEVPHHRHENYFGDPTHVRPITVEMLKKFSKKYNDWHISVYNSFIGFGNSLNVDFEIVDYDYIICEPYAQLAREGKLEELSAIAQRFNNVYSDLKIKLMVIKDGK